MLLLGCLLNSDINVPLYAYVTPTVPSLVVGSVILSVTLADLLSSMPHTGPSSLYQFRKCDTELCTMTLTIIE